MKKKTLSLLLSVAVILVISSDEIRDIDNLIFSEVSEDTFEKGHNFINKELLLNNELTKITLNGIETQKNSILGGEHRVKMTVSNKSIYPIEVQSADLFIDGNSSSNTVSFSEYILAGEQAEVSMDILALDNDLQELNNQLDFTLKILDGKTFNNISDEKINIKLA